MAHNFKQCKSRMIAGWVAVLSAVLFMCSQHVFGHAAGPLGVDNYLLIIPQETGLRLVHDVHLGELPSAAVMLRMDSDRSGSIEHEEIMDYMRRAAPIYASGINIAATVEGERHVLRLEVPDGDIEDFCHARIVIDEGDVQTLRYTWTFETEWPEEAIDSDFMKLEVWRIPGGQSSASWVFAYEIPEEPVRVLSGNIPDSGTAPMPSDITEEVEQEDELPSAIRANLYISLSGEGVFDEDARTKLASEPAAPKRERETPRGLEGGEDALRKRVLNLVRTADTPGTYAAILFLCFIWGALHAFGPGHGKVIASTYLVSAKASYIHAVMLGILITITHTAVVIILAIAATILKDRFVYPAWLQPMGAIIILLVGVRQITIGIRKALKMPVPHGHSHDHHHHHDHPHNHSHGAGKETVTKRDIGALGLSGGMVPCPASIVLLLLTWQVAKPVFGLFAIITFSIGLALTLVAVGVMAISGTRIIMRWLSKPDSGHDEHRFINSVIPIIGGILLIVFGSIILMG